VDDWRAVSRLSVAGRSRSELVVLPPTACTRARVARRARHAQPSLADERDAGDADPTAPVATPVRVIRPSAMRSWAWPPRPWVPPHPPPPNRV